MTTMSFPPAGSELDSRPTPPSPPSYDDVILYVYPGEEIRIKPGETAVLDCLVSDPSLKVQWIRPGRNRNQRQSDFSGRLIIENISPGEAGVYRCALNPQRPGGPPVEKLVRIFVEGKLRCLYRGLRNNYFNAEGGEEEPVTEQPPPSPTRAPFTPPQQQTTTARPVIISRCRPDQATCMNGQCIPRSGLCNGVQVQERHRCSARHRQKHNMDILRVS